MLKWREHPCLLLPLSQPSDVLISPNPWLPARRSLVQGAEQASPYFNLSKPKPQQGREILRGFRSLSAVWQASPEGAISSPCCTAPRVSKGAEDVVWHRPACHVRASLKNERFLLFPLRRKEHTPAQTHTHTQKSISRWVSGNSSFNYNSPLSWMRGRVGRLAMRRLQWHTGKDSPWGCTGTTSDAGGKRGEITHFPQCAPSPTWGLPRSDLTRPQSGRPVQPVPLLTLV